MTKRETPPGVRLYLDDKTIPDEVKKRHITRYMTAISQVGFSGGRWLDAACGTGYGSYLMTDYADEVVGVDMNAKAIRYARGHYAKISLNGKQIRFKCADLLGEPVATKLLAETQFHTVISVETIEHLTQKQQSAWIRRVAREYLAPEGVFVLSTPIRKGGGPNPKNPHHLWEPDMDALLSVLGLYFDTATKFTHMTEMTTGEKQQNLYVRCSL